MQANLAGFNRWMTLFAQTSRKSFAQILAQQAKLLVRDALHFTPPMKMGSSFGEGKKLGENAIIADTARAFTAVNAQFRAKPDAFFASKGLPPAELRASVATHLAWYLGQRNKNKKITIALEPKRAIFTNDLQAVRQKLKDRQGFLASGWMPAANALKVAVPQWISRHTGNGAGGIQFVNSATEISVTCTNNREFSQARRLQSILSQAVLKRSRAMQRQTLFAMARKIAKQTPH